jgi:hypothetical protein
MSDGTLYSCGQNYQGQLGLRKQWGMKDDQFNEILKPLALHQFSGTLYFIYKYQQRPPNKRHSHKRSVYSSANLRRESVLFWFRFLLSTDLRHLHPTCYLHSRQRRCILCLTIEWSNDYQPSSQLSL